MQSKIGNCGLQQPFNVLDGYLIDAWMVIGFCDFIRVVAEV